jgi:predicted transposase/invertase (TIGR01784 family)
MKRYDILWKGILENVCDDFLRFFFKDADSIFDMKREFQFLDKELEQLFPAPDQEDPKFVDKLVKVFTKSGKEEWILVHIEVQGYSDPDFARRMFTYFYRILDKYNKPVTAIAIFTDSSKTFRPHLYKYEYLGTTATFQFNTFKIMDQDEAGLLHDANPFAVVILTVLLALKTKKLDDDSLYRLKYSMAKNLLKKSFSKKKINDLMVFLQRYVRFANSEFNIKFEREIEELTQNQKTMGIVEQVLDMAKREGMEQGKAEVVRNLLAAGRFTTLEIANFASVSETFVLEIKKTLN